MKSIKYYFILASEKFLLKEEPLEEILREMEADMKGDDREKVEEAEELQRLGEYRAIASQLTSQTLKIGAKAGASGKIFGSVTSVQIAAAIKDQLGLEILRKKIELPVEVKELGTYTAIINLHKEVIGKVEFEVSAE